MYTVVVPTMWRFKPFLSFLKSLLNYELVGEVILINNDNENTPEEFTSNLINQIYGKKLKIFNFNKNIGVNPAWNLGVEKSKYDKICILNDDVIFDLSLFDKCIPYLELRNTGVMGLCPGVDDFNQPPFIDGSIDITEWNMEHTYGFGCLMFINKKNYLKIPQDLFLYYGDNYIFDGCLANRQKNYIISNIVHYTPFAVTSSEVGKGYLDIETPIYEKAITDIKWALGIFNIEYEKALNIESDIQTLLPILNDMAYKIDSVLELGVRSGLSTRAFLNANLKKLTSIDLEEDFFVRDLFNVADVINRDYKYIIDNTLNYANYDNYDLLFVDSDHTYNQVKSELEKYHTYINKYIVFHDVFTYGIRIDDEKSIGILPAIMEFLVENKEWTIKKYTTESNGLMVLERISND